MSEIFLAGNEVQTQDELEDLRLRLKRIRQQRAVLATRRRECQTLQAPLDSRVHQLTVFLQGEVESYQSVVFRRQSLHHTLALLSRWNVVNDCFHIWHSGPWATINGARLGGEAPRLPAGLLHPQDSLAGASSHDASSNKPDEARSAPHPPRRYLLWSSTAAANASQHPASAPAPYQDGAAASRNLSPNSSTPQPPPAAAPKVPWSEVNAALGHSVLLLQILKDKGGWILPHELMPMASTSQMGVRRRTNNNNNPNNVPPPVVYNLYFDESGFSFFKGATLRNFNVALLAFAECLHVASQQLTDKTIAMPHPMQLTVEEGATVAGGGGPLGPGVLTIGGCSLVYQETTAVDFTRACKYLLTNLKWLVAYTVKHHMER
eukprot:Nitzschia sp. Nitz4//scaffold90_size81538//62898//64028//NITZ4_005326-RA/size81538-processed-gene-0.54-mRNA-1//-1//CDS//3329560032//8729//frame0